MAIGSQVSTGAKLELKIGGVTVAYANQCSYTVNHNMQPIETFNEHTINELAELGVTCEFSASYFRVNRKAAISLGLMPKIANFLTQPELTMLIKDKISDAVLVTITGAKCTSRSGSVDARGVFTESLSFQGRVMNDEEGL
jgi:hypothetical protein